MIIWLTSIGVNAVEQTNKNTNILSCQTYNESYSSKDYVINETLYYYNTPVGEIVQWACNNTFFVDVIKFNIGDIIPIDTTQFYPIQSGCVVTNCNRTKVMSTACNLDNIYVYDNPEKIKVTGIVLASILIFTVFIIRILAYIVCKYFQIKENKNGLDLLLGFIVQAVAIITIAVRGIIQNHLGDGYAQLLVVVISMMSIIEVILMIWAFIAGRILFTDANLKVNDERSVALEIGLAASITGAILALITPSISDRHGTESCLWRLSLDFQDFAANSDFDANITYISSVVLAVVIVTTLTATLARYAVVADAYIPHYEKIDKSEKMMHAVPLSDIGMEIESRQRE